MAGIGEKGFDAQEPGDVVEQPEMGGREVARVVGDAPVPGAPELFLRLQEPQCELTGVPALRLDMDRKEPGLRSGLHDAVLTPLLANEAEVTMKDVTP